MIRDDLIERVRERFGKDLKYKEDESMTSFYLFELKDMYGFFWLYKSEGRNGGYMIEFQKIKNLCEKFGLAVHSLGGYPCKILKSDSDINEVLNILNYIYLHFTERENKKTSDNLKFEEIIRISRNQRAEKEKKE